MILLNKITFRINNLLSKVTSDSINEAHKVIDKYFYLSSKFPPFTFEKCMLKMLSKVYHQEMYNKLEYLIYHNEHNNKEFSNIFVPFCIIKYKYKKEIDKNIDKYINLCDSKFKNKMLKIITNSEKQEKFTYKFFYIDDCICNFRISTENGDFYEFYNKKIITQNSSEDKFIQLVNLFVEKKYIQCKKLIKDILVDVSDIQKLHIYNLLIYCYFNLGMYQESIYYIDRCLSMSEITYNYFIHYKFLIERFGNSYGLYSKLFFEHEFNKLLHTIKNNLNESLIFEKNLLKNDVKYILNVNDINDLNSYSDLNYFCLNNRLINNFRLENKINVLREIRNLEENTKNLIRNLKNEFLVISIHCIQNFLYLNVNFNHIINTNLDYNLIRYKYQAILRKNRESFYEKNKERWWLERIKLNNEMKELMNSVNYNLMIEKECIILILDEKTSEFPFEHTIMLHKYHTYRILSSEFLQTNSFVSKTYGNDFYTNNDIQNKNFLDTSTNHNKISYSIFNVDFKLEDKNFDTKNFRRDIKNNNLNILKYNFIIDNSLQNTYKRITNEFTYLKEDNFNCICYFGHGNGNKYLSNYKDKILFLFGCSSVKLICRDNFKKNSTILKHIKNNRIVLGCLYEVTDKDIDIFSIELLKSNGDLSKIVKKAQSKMKLKWLNGCSIVIYGMPFIYKSNIKKNI